MFQRYSQDVTAMDLRLASCLFGVWSRRQCFFAAAAAIKSTTFHTTQLSSFAS